MKYLLLFTLIVSLYACKDSNSEFETELGVDTLMIIEKDTVIDQPQEKIFQDSLKKYFEKPLDFYALKKATMHMHSGGNIKLDNAYFYPPPDSSYIFYDYWAVEFSIREAITKSYLSFKVLKPWGNAEDRYYEKDNEILLGIKSNVSWEGLEHSNFVGLDIEVIQKRFSDPMTVKNDCWIYTYDDKILIIGIDQDQVEWFKYFWLKETITDIKILPESCYYWEV